MFVIIYFQIAHCFLVYSFIHVLFMNLIFIKSPLDDMVVICVVRVAAEVLHVEDEANTFCWLGQNFKDFGGTNGLCISMHVIDIILACS